MCTTLCFIPEMNPLHRFASGGEEPLRRGARRHAAQVRQTVPQLRRVSQTNPNAQARQGRGRRLTEIPDLTYGTEITQTESCFSGHIHTEWLRVRYRLWYLYL